MSKIIRFLAQRRFNYVDSVAATGLAAYYHAGEYLAAALIFIIGLFISIALERATNDN